MRTFDLTPLYRLSVGYDHLNRLLDTVSRFDEQAASYPPYDIVKLGEDNYRISMAVAGFTPDELDVTVNDGTLVISGRKEPKDTADDGGGLQYLHRGIATRSFERKFELADFIRVAEAKLVDGLLGVDLVREVPEHMKPRTIAIKTDGSGKTIEHKKAA